LKQGSFIKLKYDSETEQNLKALSGSPLNFALSNDTTFGQIRTGATIPLGDKNIPCKNFTDSTYEFWPNLSRGYATSDYKEYRIPSLLVPKKIS
jgi:hypothetical protein